MDKSTANKDLAEQERLRIIKYMAEFNGKITAAWHKMREGLGKDLGDSDEDNIFFLCFHAGACEGSLINNTVWMEHNELQASRVKTETLKYGLEIKNDK